MTAYEDDLDERFFANHKFENGIGLAEYELASRKLDGEEKAFLWATNMAAVLAPAIWFFGYRLHQDWSLNGYSPDSLPTITTVFLVFSTLFSLMSTIHVTNLRKGKVIAERKIVLLRRAMGVRYGENSLILPSWRLEGADNPFGLRLYPGLFSYASFPVVLLSGFSSLSIILFFDNIPFGQAVAGSYQFAAPTRLAIVSGLIWFSFVIFVFKYNLREQNENAKLWFAQALSWLVEIPIVRDVEYKLYRCKLEISEAFRIEAPIDKFGPFAIAIEDKEFRRHKGLSWRGMARAIWHYLRRRRISGGSTITQQCARTNFLTTLKPPFRRKLVEMALAKWLESVLSKQEILAIYLTTARFESGVYGFHRAARHFFGSLEGLRNAHAFFIIERAGNIRGMFLGHRVQELLARLSGDKIISVGEISEVLEIYEKMIDCGKIANVEGPTPGEIRSALGLHHYS